MIRTFGARSVNDTRSSRCCSEYPTIISRDSSAECSGSSKMRANESANTVDASSNVTPCFRLFSSAFAGSHSNSMLIGELPRGDTVIVVVRFHPIGPTAAAHPRRPNPMLLITAAAVGCSAC